MEEDGRGHVDGQTGIPSVFIAFRRGAGDRTALALYQTIRDAGGDVFLDVAAAPDGERTAAQLRQIAARDVFLLVVGPRTLEPCADPDDGLGAQIAQAKACGRSIAVSLSAHLHDQGLDGLLAALGSRVREWLSGAVVLSGVDVAPVLSLPPRPAEVELGEDDQRVADEVRRFADSQPPVTPAQLQAQHALERANTRALDDSQGRVADYAEAIRLDPEYAEAYARRGANRDLLGDVEGARQDLKTAIRLDPDLDIAHFNLGMLHVGQRALDEARQAFDVAIRLNSNLTQAYYQRGLIRAQAGDLAGAIADHSTVIELNPRSAAAYFHRGMAHAKHEPTPDFQAAMADWTEAIRLNPSFLEAHYNRGLVRANLGDLPGTLEDMEHVLALIPDQDSRLARQVQATLDDIRRRMGAS